MHYIWDKPTFYPLPPLLDGNFPPFYKLIYVSSQVGEGLLHINGIPSWGFNVFHAVGYSQFFSLMPRHLPLSV